MASQSTPLNPTFEGYIASTLDALILFEACLSGQLNHVPRRPHDRERQDLIRSGNIFIYEEHASGIKRWTDGVSWSPSRILGNFLIYRELEKPFPPGEKKRALKKNKKCQQGVIKNEATPRPSSSFSAVVDPSTVNRDTERSLIGSLIDSYPFKNEGLVKKTISITFQGVPHHLVSYYNIEDVTTGRLTTPSKHPSFQAVHPRGELLMAQNFRAPLDEIEYHGEDRGGMIVATAFMPQLPGMGPEYIGHPNVLPRTMSLPSFQQPHSPVYTTTPPYAFPPPHHPQQHQAQQHAYLPSVSASGPSPSLQYMPQPAANYSLDPSRATRYSSNAGMTNEFPRNMPPDTPTRRHSTFDVTQPSEMTTLALNGLNDGRPLPTVNGFITSQSNSYFLPHRPAQLMESDQNFSSPRLTKSEPDAMVNGGEGIAQPYGLGENGAAWAYETTLDGPAAEHHYYGHPGDESQHWHGGPDGLSRA